MKDENTMTIPEPDHTADNYETANETVAAARKRLEASTSDVLDEEPPNGVA